MTEATDDRLRAMKPEDRREMQMVLDTYCAAMGLA